MVAQRSGDKSSGARVSVARVTRELCRRNFAVLATASDDGRPHAAGVTYGACGADQNLVIYVMTRSHLQKARDIARNPRVALVVPLRRWLLWFLPPATIQLRGQAEILDGADAQGVAVFQRFWMGRHILRAYDAERHRGETRICFLKIVLDPTITTYMLGASILQIRSHMEAGAARVTLPTALRPLVPSCIGV